MITGAVGGGATGGEAARGGGEAAGGKVSLTLSEQLGLVKDMMHGIVEKRITNERIIDALCLATEGRETPTGTARHEVY